MNRRGFTLVEAGIATVILAVVLGVAVHGLHVAGRQSRFAMDALAQTQDVEIFMETVRQELTAMVMNPLPAGQLHEGNTFMRSEPNHTGIQFVMARTSGAGLKRFLVSYVASNAPGARPGTPLVLRRDVFEFNRTVPWTDRISPQLGWRPEWLGAHLESDTHWSRLDVMDLRWTHRAPPWGESREFFRVDLVVLARDGKRLLPYSTLVGVPTAGDPESYAACPDLFTPDLGVPR